MKSFVIPSIFTAIDKFSSPVKGMSRNIEVFASKAEIGIARSERAFRKLTPVLSETSKQFLSMASTAAIAGAIIAGGAFSTKSLMDYETELQNLQAITGVSGKGFDLFKSKIQDVAAQTKTSSVDVAKAFTAIANNQPELLKDADALAAVSKSSILLAHASKMELQPAGEALTQILNQFGKGAKDAAATIDILAAGSVAGSSEIRDTAEAIQKFGTVAANAGIKINESVALIELASKFEKGAEAGSKLRNILITMSSIKVQDPKALADLRRLGVNMNIVADKSLPLNTRLQEMSKISKSNAALFHVFGKENQALATGVLSTAANFNTMLKAVNTTGKAQEMAAKNNDTLKIALQQASAAWVNMLTSSDNATAGLVMAKTATRFVTDHLRTIVTIGVSVIGFFAAWKVVLILSKVSMVAYNIVLGLNNAITKTSTVYTASQTVAMNTQVFATKAATAAQWLWNAAMSANPLGFIIIGIAALIGLVTAVVKKWNDWGAALSIFLGPLGIIISLVQSFRRNWDMITEAFSKGGILEGLKAIGATLLDAILMPLQQILSLIAKVSGFEWAANAASSIEKFRSDIGVNVDTDENGNPLPGKVAINNKGVQHEAIMQKMEQTNHAKATLTINDPDNRTSVKSEGKGLNIVTTSTMVGASGNW